MTRRVVGLFLLAVVAGSVGTLIARDPGYVLLVWSDFSFETSFWFAGVLLLLALLILRGGMLLFEFVFGSRSGVLAWTSGRRQRRSRRLALSGQLARARGDFAAARRAFEGSAASARTAATRSAGKWRRTIDREAANVALLNEIEAARAAQALGDLEGRDEHLRAALEGDSRATLPVGIAQAELQLDAGQWEPALATLLELRREVPRNAHVLRMLRRALEEVGDLQGLLGLILDLRRTGLPEDEVARLEREAWITYLAGVGSPEDGSDGPAAVKSAWEAVPKALRSDAGLLAVVALRLDAVGDGDGAAALLKTAVDKEWNVQLVEVYGRITGGDAAQRGKQAARWAKAHAGDPMLELTRARLALRAERFGEARAHYASSLSQRETPEVCAELGRLETRLGDPERGAELLERALVLRAAPPLELPLPTPGGALERVS